MFEVLEKKVEEGSVVTAESESKITSASGDTGETTGEEATTFLLWKQVRQTPRLEKKSTLEVV